VARPAPTSTDPTWWAETPVAVSDGAATELSVTLRPGLRVSGHVVFEGSAPRPTPQRLQQVTVTLGGVDSRTSVPVTAARADADGRFTTGGYPPGRYTMNVSQPGPEWSLRSIQIGGINALEQPVVLESADVGNVIVTFSDRMQELSGSVQEAAANPDERFTVVLFPADHQQWAANGMFGRRAATANTSSTGTFQMRVLLPGDYLVAALPQDIAVEQTPQFYAAVARVATRVSIGEGEKRSLSIAVSRLR
jgi:hypothetical protein